MVSQFEPERVAIALYGYPSSGRQTLTAMLDGYRYRRPSDGRVVVFDLKSRSDGTPPLISLVLIDATNADGDYGPLIKSAKSATRHSYILYTRADLLPVGFSPIRLRYLRSQRYLSFTYDIDYISSNLTDQGCVNALAARLVERLSPVSSPTSPGVETTWDHLCTTFMDWIASCFALPTNSKIHRVDDEISSITTDGDVARLVRDAAAWDEELKRRLHAEDARSVAVHRITPSLLAKATASSSERASMEYVRRHTSIPVPRTYHPHLSWLLMEYIDGHMLSECWSTLSALMQFRIACTLRLYVKQMRSLHRPTPGAFDTGYVGGIFFQEEKYGPFDSVRRFRQFCDWVSFEGWHNVALARHNSGRVPPPLPLSNTGWNPTFIHGDLNHSNILLDRRGTLWLLDWDTAGFYPACLEALAMRLVDDELHPGVMPPSWARYRSFIVGKPTSDEAEYWLYVYSAIHRFRQYAVDAY
ncbi:hypothetical protein BV20DRAFT_1009276 [Pilatotrama ljubarskyi]|nr:hypothetical protein BV20DRAFT_1009276 [Pilatotrama ljubarskyi]